MHSLILLMGCSPYIVGGAYKVMTPDGHLVGLVQSTESSGGATIHEQWVVTTDERGGVTGDFATEPYRSLYGTVSLKPFPNRMPWTKADHPDTGGAVPLLFSRLGSGGSDFLAAVQASTLYGTPIHYVDSTATVGPAVAPTATEALKDGKTRHWNEVLLRKDGTVLGYAYAEWSVVVDPPAPPYATPTTQTRLWELVVSRDFHSTDPAKGLDHIQTGDPISGAAEPETLADWYITAVKALGKPSALNLISGTVFGYDKVPPPE